MQQQGCKTVYQLTVATTWAVPSRVTRVSRQTLSASSSWHCRDLEVRWFSHFRWVGVWREFVLGCPISWVLCCWAEATTNLFITVVWRKVLLVWEQSDLGYTQKSKNDNRNSRTERVKGKNTKTFRHPSLGIKESLLGRLRGRNERERKI